MGLFFFSIIFVYLQMDRPESDGNLSPTGSGNILFEAMTLSEQRGASSLAMAEGFRLRGNAAAEIAYRQAYAAGVEDPALWRKLAVDYAKQGNWFGAQAAWEKVLQLAPQDDQALYELALQRLPFDAREAYELFGGVVATSAFGESSNQLRELIAAVEMETPAFQMFRFGQALAALERWDQAEQALSLAAALEPNYAEAWAYLGFVRVQVNRPSAVEAIERGLLLAPDTALVWLMAGLSWEAQGDLDNALQALLTAQALEPLNPVIALELGHVYRQRGDLASAEYWLQAAGAGSGDSSFARSLALFYAEEAYDLDGAGLATLREAVDQWPQDVALLSAYGWALASAGDPAAGLAQINTALAIGPDDPRALYYEGLVLMQSGETELARATFETILALDEPNEFDMLARRALTDMD